MFMFWFHVILERVSARILSFTIITPEWIARADWTIARGRQAFVCFHQNAMFQFHMRYTLVGPRKPLVAKFARIRNVAMHTIKMPIEIRLFGEFLRAQRTLLHVSAVENNIVCKCFFFFYNYISGSARYWFSGRSNDETRLLIPLGLVRTVMSCKMYFLPPRQAVCLVRAHPFVQCHDPVLRAGGPGGGGAPPDSAAVYLTGPVLISINRARFKCIGGVWWWHCRRTPSVRPCVRASGFVEFKRTQYYCVRRPPGPGYFFYICLLGFPETL